MKGNIIKDKSYAFALRIIRMYNYLSSEKKEFVLSKQVLRSGTSIGANVEEAVAAQSKPEFIHKLNLSLKEAKETHYWLRLLKDSDFISHESFESISSDCEVLLKLLTSIIKSTKQNYSPKGEIKS